MEESASYVAFIYVTCVEVVVWMELLVDSERSGILARSCALLVRKWGMWKEHKGIGGCSMKSVEVLLTGVKYSDQ